MTDPGGVALDRNLLIAMSDGVELGCLSSTTEVSVERPVRRTDLVVTTLTTAHEVSITATITVDGSPFWTRAWRRLGSAAANPDRREAPLAPPGGGR